MKRRTLSPAERLELTRRRLGLSQAEAAEKYGVPETLWVRWENGEPFQWGPFDFANEKLSPGELCWLLRRRAGLTMSQVAKAAKVSKSTLHRIESNLGGNHQKVLDWWKKRSHG